MRLCGRKGKPIPRICLLKARLNHPSPGLKGYNRLNFTQTGWLSQDGVVLGCHWHVGHSAVAVDRLVLVTSTPAVIDILFIVSLCQPWDGEERPDVANWLSHSVQFGVCYLFCSLVDINLWSSDLHTLYPLYTCIHMPLTSQLFSHHTLSQPAEHFVTSYESMCVLTLGFLLPHKVDGEMWRPRMS